MPTLRVCEEPVYSAHVHMVCEKFYSHTSAVVNKANQVLGLITLILFT